MARQTRAERRARRAEREGQANGAEVRPVQRSAQMRAAAPQPAAERQLPGSRGKRFVAESMAELKKVEWPGQQQLIQGVVVVLIACVIVGAYLWGADQVFKRLVQNVLLATTGWTLG
jgi:preprotein translocase subunit SecE